MHLPPEVVESIKSLYENGLLAFIQAVLVVAGLFYAGRQLKLARRSFQATVVSQISERSSQLQLEVMKDVELQPLLGFPSAAEWNKNAIGKYKRALVSVMIINHFARIYDLWQLRGIPNEIWNAFEADLQDVVTHPTFGNTWSRLKNKGWHRPDFVALVDGLIERYRNSRREQERV
jgi:hypothetical protein